MAAEDDRITVNKRIKLPSGATVLFPIIRRITFTDAVNRAQAAQYEFDNSVTGDRETHLGFVMPDGTPNVEDAPLTATPAGALPVERIDKWTSIDGVARGQETQHSPDNRTGAEGSGPPYFPQHQRTRVLRVKNDPDDGNWIETEVFDEYVDLDPVNRAQERRFTLENPIGTDDGNGNMCITADSADALEDDSDTGIDPTTPQTSPGIGWRIDPFQNIVNFNSQEMTFWWPYVATIGSVGGLQVYDFTNTQNPADPSTQTGTTADGKVFVLTGKPNLPTPLSWGPNANLNISPYTPWWITAATGGTPGPHYYDADGPTASLTQSWPFSLYRYDDDGNPPAFYETFGSLAVSIGPLSLTVDGIPWVQKNVHIYMIAASTGSGFAPGWAPSFTVTFQPP